MKCLGLDIASKTGWGIVERVDGKERLSESGIIDATDMRQIRKFVSWLWENHPDLGRCWIESTYVARGPHANPEVTIQLAQKAGAFRYALSERLAVDFVSPAQWRAEVLSPPGKLQRADLKRLAQSHVKLAFRIQVSADEAEAICIAFYGVRRMLFGG